MHEAIHMVRIRTIHRAKSDLFVKPPTIPAHNEGLRVVIVTIRAYSSLVEPLDHATDMELVSTGHQSQVGPVGETNGTVVPIKIAGTGLKRVHRLDGGSIHKNWSSQGWQ